MEGAIPNERATDLALNNGNAGTLLCIWLVDDDDGWLGHMTQLLNAQPRMHCSRYFSSASSLLRALKYESPPDIILMDVEMPGMSGIEAIAPVKHLAPCAIVLILTTFFDCRLAEQALAAGAVDLLLKRNPPGQIIAAIRLASRGQLFVGPIHKKPEAGSSRCSLS